MLPMGFSLQTSALFFFLGMIIYETLFSCYKGDGITLHCIRLKLIYSLYPDFDNNGGISLKITIFVLEASRQLLRPRFEVLWGSGVKQWAIENKSTSYSYN